MADITVEVCVEDAAGLAAAVAGGAHRIELCSALAVGGLTPSVGFMRLAGTCPVPVYAMMRPRAGAFVYSADEIDQIKRDMDAAAQAGLKGVVLGVSAPSNALNVDACAALAAYARTAGLAATLHRAIDLAPDLLAAVDVAIEAGFERILTSGGRRSAPAGADAIAAMVERAGDRISIMAGSGVKADNAAALIAQTGVCEVHSSCSGPPPERNLRLVELGFANPSARVTVAEEVAALVAAVRA
ncbi:MAG TPA: copper homeostasis protein CutC [Caulobacteraceae bacterium]|jgi:copper homeostasis protein|nr:copper homeostasis protein CutC [Caulobacteraceae bacterium]